jgi:hypothetical protein
VGLAKEREVEQGEGAETETEREEDREKEREKDSKETAVGTEAAAAAGETGGGEAAEGEEKPAGEPKKVVRNRKKAADKQGAEKRPDRIFLPQAKDAIPIRPNSAEMFVLQHLRDEAHRFAVTFHRRRRKSLTLRSALADVPGIGPQRQRVLLRNFGSLKKIRDATLDELSAVPGMTQKAAAAVLAHLGSTDAAEARAVESGQVAGPDAEQDALESAFAEVEGSDDAGADDGASDDAGADDAEVEETEGEIDPTR